MGFRFRRAMNMDYVDVTFENDNVTLELGFMGQDELFEFFQNQVLTLLSEASFSLNEENYNKMSNTVKGFIE